MEEQDPRAAAVNQQKESVCKASEKLRKKSWDNFDNPVAD